MIWQNDVGNCRSAGWQKRMDVQMAFWKHPGWRISNPTGMGIRIMTSIPMPITMLIGRLSDGINSLINIFKRKNSLLQGIFAGKKSRKFVASWWNIIKEGSDPVFSLWNFSENRQWQTERFCGKIDRIKLKWVPWPSYIEKPAIFILFATPEVRPVPRGQYIGATTFMNP